MVIENLKKEDIKELKKIYLEAFPKSERKPFFSIKGAINEGRSRVFVAKEENKLIGFIITIPYKNLVLVDYLAVSNKVRSKGTGSMLMKKIIEYYDEKIIVLEIEKLNKDSDNCEQRISRKNFYLKNGFKNTHFNINGVSGEMEVLSYQDDVKEEEFLNLMKYALGPLFYKFSKLEVVRC